MQLEHLTMEELASYVCSELEKKDIKVVLSGGSCMELYTNAMYSSYDLDFVMRYSYDLKQIEKTMKELGFILDGKYYVVPNSKFFVEILRPPVAVGDQFLNKFAKKETKVGTLVLLTPTDCIKERLCGCYLHNDKKCFEHALAVGYNNEIEEDELKTWAKNEDKIILEGVKYFLDTLEMLKNPTNEAVSLFLLDFTKRNNIDIEDELAEQDLIDDLFHTYPYKVLFKNFTKEQIIAFVKKEEADKL